MLTLQERTYWLLALSDNKSDGSVSEPKKIKQAEHKIDPRATTVLVYGDALSQITKAWYYLFSTTEDISENVEMPWVIPAICRILGSTSLLPLISLPWGPPSWIGVSELLKPRQAGVVGEMWSTTTPMAAKCLLGMFTPVRKLITPFKKFGSEMKLRARRSQSISDDSLAKLQISQFVQVEEQRVNL